MAAMYSQAGALGGLDRTGLRRVRKAIFVLLVVTTNCWPSEPLAVRAQDLAPPSRQVVSRWSLHRSPAPASRYSDRDFLGLVAPHTTFLEPTLTVLQENESGTSLWTFTHPDLVAALAETASKLRVSVTAHQARHSRPPIDLAWTLRDTTSVQKRGRWAAMSSILRYERHARLATKWAELQEDQWVLFSTCEQPVEDFIYSRGEMLHLPYSWSC